MRQTLSALAAPLLWAGLLGLFGAAPAQAQTPPPARPSPLGWQACQALKGDDAGQLACFQQWADSQLRANTPAPSLTTAPANPATGQPATPVLLLPSLNTEAPDGKPIGCKNTKYSELSRFWELQRGTDCDTFSLRGYRPISLAVVTSDSVNTQPSSPTLGHTALTAQPYMRTENKIQLSVRTKMAKGLLKKGDNDRRPRLAVVRLHAAKLLAAVQRQPVAAVPHHRPRAGSALHLPAPDPLPGGWTLPASGLGLVHQSNGQSLPLSRSWNRVYLMGAAEKPLGQDSGLILQGRIWDRLKESSGNDDNPGIEDYVGRAEVTGSWQINKANTVGVTLRHSLRKEARGSARLDWMMAPSSSPNYTGLRYHVQLFNGYGDSLVDYNRKRTVLSVGLSLVDW
jgi:phospholipase A1